MTETTRKEKAIQYAFDVYKILFITAGGFAAGWIASNNATMEMYQSETPSIGPPISDVPEVAFWILAPGIFYFVWTVFPWPGKGGGLRM